MIAYHHKIKFIPKLGSDTSVVEDSFTNEIIIRERQARSVIEKMAYELTFFNNQGRDLDLYTEREFDRTQQDQLWAFVVKDVVAFFWHSGTLTLEYIPHKNFTLKLLQYWSLQIVLPIFLTLEERYDFLHAGAVEMAGKPLLFIAESFGGKSTMTDFFMQQGHPMISDDKVATYEKDGNFFAVPSHPHHRPYRQEEDLGFFVENFSTGPKPVHAIYELEKSEADATIKITKLTGVEKFVALRRASEMNLYFLKPKRFAFLAQMVGIIPLFKVTVPWQLNRLSLVYQAIAKHTLNI